MQGQQTWDAPVGLASAEELERAESRRDVFGSRSSSASWLCRCSGEP